MDPTESDPGAASAPRVVRRSGRAGSGPHGEVDGPRTGGPRPDGTVLGVPVRYVVAVAATVVAVLVLVVASSLGGDEEDQVAVTTSTSTLPPPPLGGPPRTIEVQPDWYRKGYSLYSERGPTPTVSSLPPTTVDEDEGSSDGRSRSSGGSSGSSNGSG